MEDAMDRLHLETDWLDGDGIQGPELAATFARLTVRIGDSVLTRAFDRDTSDARDFVRVANEHSPGRAGAVELVEG